MAECGTRSAGVVNEPQMSSVRQGTVDVGALIAPKRLVHEVRIIHYYVNIMSTLASCVSSAR
eukprot:532549-Pyramimonas_sp.AAC.1